jgi:two-component system, OmpR family, sensor histidine kinase ArlS
MRLNKIRFATISWKLTLIYAGIFFLVLTLLNAAILYGVHYFLMRQARAQVSDTGDMIIDQFHESGQKRADLFDKDLVLGIPSNDNIYVKIVDKHGNIMNESAKFNLRIPEKIPLKTNKMAIIQRHLLYQNRMVFVNNKPYAYLQVVKSLANDAHVLKVLAFLMLVAELTGIFISILSGHIISREMLKPISNITTTAQSISINDLNQRINVIGPQDELTDLATTFNAMIDRLQQSFDRQNQFVSDASHELRTPISVIQGYINLLDRWGKEEKTILQESITVIKSEAANMAELIEKLLFLARGDSSVRNLCRESFWLHEFIEEVYKETKIIAGNHQVLLEHNDKVLFCGDRKMLKQMLRALLDNSIKFTPESGKIMIHSFVEGDVIRLVLEDTGIGIPETEIPYIFNRFYQVDKVRLQSGSGLGLAIVKWIVDAHQGTISVESKIGNGTRVSIVLPVMKT